MKRITKRAILATTAVVVAASASAVAFAEQRPDADMTTYQRRALELAAIAEWANKEGLAGLSPASLHAMPCRGLSPASAQDCPPEVFADTSAHQDAGEKP